MVVTIMNQRGRYLVGGAFPKKRTTRKGSPATRVAMLPTTSSFKRRLSSVDDAAKYLGIKQTGTAKTAARNNTPFIGVKWASRRPSCRKREKSSKNPVKIMMSRIVATPRGVMSTHFRELSRAQRPFGGNGLGK